jgi:GT2 family glycosyltransferase
MKVSLVFLTWNRLDFVKRAVTNNVKNCGYPIHEIIWCDNGSTDGTREWMQQFLSEYRHKSIINQENLGVAKGYNAIYKHLGDTDLVARPSSDMCMPNNWLKDMVEWHARIPQTGIVAMISDSYKDYVHHRYLGDKVDVNGYTVQPANALGSIVFKKEIIDKDILLPEESLYGYEDTRWTNAVRENGYINYYIDGIVHDYPREEIQKYPEYVKWKGDIIRKFEEENRWVLELNKHING